MNDQIPYRSDLKVGVLRGVIENNKDPDKLGRVQVRYNWIRNSDITPNIQWARVCRPVSTSQYGDWFLPEVGDEVLVAYEGGDSRKPVIIGSFYHENNPVPEIGHVGDYNQDDKNNLRFIKTKSGHTLVFDDDEESQSIKLFDAENNLIQIDTKNKTISIIDKAENKIIMQSEEKFIRIEDTHQNSILLDEKGMEMNDKFENNVKMTEEGIHGQDKHGNYYKMNDSGMTLNDSGGNKVELKQSESIELTDSNSNQVQLKSGGITINSGSKIVINGSSGIELGEGASQKLIKGDAFMSFFNSHNHMTPRGPSSPPMSPMNPSMLSRKHKTS